MAKRGTPARANWLPDNTEKLIKKRGYSGYTSAAEANDISPTSLKKLFDSPPPGLLNAYRFALDLADGDPATAWQVLSDMTRQFPPSSATIVPAELKRRENPKLPIVFSEAA